MVCDSGLIQAAKRFMHEGHCTRRRDHRRLRLAELMIEHGIGVAEEHAYSVKKIDSDYFDEA